jgi:hypothetical protein
MKKILFIIIIILFFNQNLSALEKQMGKVEPEVILACKEIIKGVESNDILLLMYLLRVADLITIGRSKSLISL